MNLDLMVGDILLVEGEKWYSSLIQHATRSRYSHAACYIGNDLVVESDWGGVQINPISKYEDLSFDVYRHVDAQKRYDDLILAVQWMVSKVGSGYDYLGIYGIAKNIFSKSERNMYDDKDKYWCTELIADGFFKVGLSLCSGEESHFITPAMYAWCPSLEKQYEVYNLRKVNHYM